MRKKLYIDNHKERVLFADILPYETTLLFNNRNFYRFLVKNKIETKQESKETKIFCAGNALENITNQKLKKILEIVKLEKNISIPFSFSVIYKEGKSRQLTIIHPYNQMNVIDFYNSYKDIMIYYCNQSSFSIRRPMQVDKLYFIDDEKHKKLLAKDKLSHIIKIDNQEYETFKTYFLYKDYSNVHQFYESYKFHRCEKKFEKLLRLDISKCFDSIYTHSISWAVFEKEAIKKNIDVSRGSFTGKFDTLMQNMNYNETHGIVIGPEFSRIFAEIILQRIDKNVFDKLTSEKIIQKKDYDAFRYVDDYFIFYNNEETKNKIFELLQQNLLFFKLSINESKTEILNKPIITKISIAKIKNIEIISKYFFTEHQKIKIGDSELYETKFIFYHNSENFITAYKANIYESEINYEDLTNYSLGVLDNKIKKIINELNKNIIPTFCKKNIENLFESNIDTALIEFFQSKKNDTGYYLKDEYSETDENSTEIIKKIKENCNIRKNNYYEITNNFIGIINSIFFIYDMSPRLNTSVKICSILIKIILFVKNAAYNKSYRDAVLKKIFDEVSLCLSKNTVRENSQMETLYLLLLSAQLGKEYLLSQSALEKYLNLNKQSDYDKLHYFSITTVLFYIKKNPKYQTVHIHLLDSIKKRLNENDNKKTELVLLFFDIMNCPFIDDAFKNTVLDTWFDQNAGSKLITINDLSELYFTEWRTFNFERELLAKKSKRVYD